MTPAQFDTEVRAPIDIVQLAGHGDMALRLAQELGWRSGEAVVLVNQAYCLAHAGEYGRALDVLSRAIAIGEEINHRFISALSRWTLGQVYLNLLAFSEAEQHLEQARLVAQAGNSVFFVRVSTADLALTFIAQHDLARAETLLGTVLDERGARTRHLRVCWHARAELALAQGDPTHALQIADDLIASAPNIERYGPRGIPRLSKVRGEALAALGRMEAAEAALLDAREGAREQGRHPLLWQICVSLGKLYRTMERGEDAARQCAAARVLSHELAAPLPDEALREQFLQQAFAMLPAAPVRSPRQEIKQTFGGLTAREREVAMLVAQGKSNREIAEVLVLSERTVDKHVGSILAKLDFHSRTQIAAWAVAKRLMNPTE